MLFDQPVAMCTRNRVAEAAAAVSSPPVVVDSLTDDDNGDSPAATPAPTAQPDAPVSAKKRSRTELPVSPSLADPVGDKENVGGTAKDEQREAKKPYSLRPRIALAQVGGPNSSGLQMGVLAPIQQATGSPFLHARAPLDEYEAEVYETMRENERRTLPRAEYMNKQRDINDKMRRLLVVWMVEVVQWFDMHDETLFLAVNYVDRFLSARAVNRSSLQLLGTAALMLASKYEEISPPSSAEFASMIHETTRCRTVNIMETKLAVALHFEICASTALAFLRHLMSKDDLGRASRAVQTLAVTICELGLLEYSMLEFAPSMVACASWCLAKREHGMPPWGTNLKYYTHYSLEQLEPCIERLAANRQSVDKASPVFKMKHRL